MDTFGAITGIRDSTAMKTPLLTISTLLSVLTIALSSALYSQEKGENTPRIENEPKEKHQLWLRCDVDWLFTSHEVGQDFKVIVFFHGEPISAARVVLKSGGSVMQETDTDSRGVARFFGISPGHYEARVEGGLLTPGTDVTVSGKSTERAIALEWPQNAVSVRRLNGRLTLVQKGNGTQPLQNATVELMDLRRNELVTQTYTNVDGRYEFPGVASGLYVIRVHLPGSNESQADSYDMAVDVNERAIDEQLPAMSLEQSDCEGVKVTATDNQPDKKLFDRAIFAAMEGRFDVARLTAATLINTYPDSAYASRAKQQLQKETYIGDCSLNRQPCVEINDDEP